MIRHAFKVKKDRASKQVGFVRNLPSRIDEMDLIRAAYGSVERMIDRANAQWTVDVANGVRDALPNVVKATAYVDTYCDDGRRAAPAPVVVKAFPGQFDEGQLAAIRASGALVEILEEEEEWRSPEAEEDDEEGEALMA